MPAVDRQQGDKRMGRLIVEAVSAESRFVDVAGRLVLFVSVSREEDGAPVSGLKLQHFRVAAPAGSVYGVRLESVEEVKWESQPPEPAGCYSLGIAFQGDAKASERREWIEGEFYTFAVQARFSAGGNQSAGQAVVRIESLGK
jgi:hypothetical protein